MLNAGGLFISAHPEGKTRPNDVNTYSFLIKVIRSVYRILALAFALSYLVSKLMHLSIAAAIAAAIPNPTNTSSINLIPNTSFRNILILERIHSYSYLFACIFLRQFI